MIGCKEDSITLTEEAYLPIRMSRRPDHTITFANQVNFLSIFNKHNHFVGRNANNSAHDFRVNLPSFGQRVLLAVTLRRGRLHHVKELSFMFSLLCKTIALLKWYGLARASVKDKIL